MTARGVNCLGSSGLLVMVFGVTARGLILVTVILLSSSGQSLSCSVVSPSSDKDKSDLEASDRQSASVSTVSGAFTGFLLAG